MNVILTEMADLQTALPSILEVLEAKAPFAAALLSKHTGMNIRIDDRDEQVSERTPAAGTVLSVFDGYSLHERAVHGFSIPEANRMAQELANAIETTGPARVEVGPPVESVFATTARVAPESLSLTDKLDRLHTLQRRVRKLDSRIVNVQVGYQQANEQSVFQNRVASLAQSVQRVNLQFTVFVQDRDNLRYNYASKSAAGGWENLEFSDEEIDKVVRDAVGLLRAERIEPGEYTIISAPGVTGTIVHESFGHGVETDMFLKQRARAVNYIGRPVGSTLVNILDDPTITGAPGGYFFDDEGWLAGPTIIVENGVFLRGITDLYSATALGIPRSANGRRQDYTRKAYARMSNTFFARGDTPVADLFAQVDDGIYLEKWYSGMEDPQGWGIQVTCLYGREIKNGELTGRIYSPIGVTGYLPEVLGSIRAVGDDFEMDGGGCGKGHKEWVPVASGGPHLLLKARLG